MGYLNGVGRQKTIVTVRQSESTDHGRLVFEDKFDSGVYQWTNTAGDDGAILDTTLNPQGTKYTLKNIDSDGDEAKTYAHVGLMKGIFRFESAFLMEDDNIAAVAWELVLYDGTNANKFNLKYDRDNAKWQYQNAAGTYADISGGSQTLKSGTWHKVVFWFDITNLSHLRIDCNEKSIDTSDYDADTDANATEPHTRFYLYHDSDTVNTKYVLHAPVRVVDNLREVS